MKKQLVNMRDSIATARTLNEALPYLQRYSGAIVVVKFGGNAMGDSEAMEEFAQDIVFMRQVGLNPVVVHGGGADDKQFAGQAGDQIGIHSRQACDRRGHC